MHAGSKGLAPSSWSADVGVDRHYNSLGLHHCGGGSGKSHSHPSSQQRKPKGCGRGMLIHVTFNTTSVDLLCNLCLVNQPVPHPPFPQELDITTDYFTYICSSTARDIFLGILYGYKMLLQVIALVLAFSTLKVKIKGLDDSKYIAAAIYVTSIVLAVIVVATYTLKDFVNGFAALFCTGFIIGTTVILGLVFVPKVGGLEIIFYLLSSTASDSCNMHSTSSSLYIQCFLLLLFVFTFFFLGRPS